MYFKMALRNVKKSINDYMVYFLTLTFAVCIFYSFNSVESQKALTDIISSGKSYSEIFGQMISLASIFVSFILAFLILYANNFLIKKRHKELGIYMTLGMSKNKISKILVYETFTIGLISLLLGIFIGLILSQALSILVIKMFNIPLAQYRFSISILAIIKTMIYFGIIFFIVMIFNIYIISKYKIIDLLNINKKVEEIKIKNPKIYLIMFIMCIMLLTFAYNTVLFVGLAPTNIKFNLSIVLGIIGTGLFFYSILGTVLYFIKSNKKVYFKGLNIFTIKQINSKINTNFLSITIICLMIFCTLSVLCTGITFKYNMELGLEEATPFDATASIYIDEYTKDEDIENTLKALGYNFDKDDKLCVLDEYTDGKYANNILSTVDEIINSRNNFIKISQFNNLQKMQGKEPITLNDDEILITSNFSKGLPYLKEYIKNNDTVTIDGVKYKIKNKDVIQQNLKTDYLKNNLLTIVINDEFCDTLEKTSTNLNINFSKQNNEQKQEEFEKLMLNFQNGTIDLKKYGFILGQTRDLVYEENLNLTTVILLVALYLGVIFLISSMVILALQQLSDASESIQRYETLKKLGVSKKDINKTIFVQVFVYFTLPLLLAIIHSIVGIKVANNFIMIYNEIDITIMLSSCIITALFLSLIYILYFYITYTGYKNIINNKN